MRHVAPTPRSEPTELRNLHRNSEAGLPKKNSQCGRNDMTGMALSKASPITLRTSGVKDVSECVFMKKNDFLSIRFD